MKECCCPYCEGMSFKIFIDPFQFNLKTNRWIIIRGYFPGKNLSCKICGKKIPIELYEKWFKEGVLAFIDKKGD